MLERNWQQWQHTPTPSIPAPAGWVGSCPCSGWKKALCEAPGLECSCHYDQQTMQASDPVIQAAALHRPSSKTHLGKTEQHQHPELCHLALSHPHPRSGDFK